MLRPSIFGESLFDNFFSGFPFEEFFDRKNSAANMKVNEVMKTDVKDLEDNYEVSIDLPGYDKADIHAELDKGYLTISAVKNENHDTKDEDGKYIRRERYTGSVSRSFYVGDAIEKEDIKAKYDNGILTLTVPKKQPAAIDHNKYIAIEG